MIELRRHPQQKMLYLLDPLGITKVLRHRYIVRLIA